MQYMDVSAQADHLCQLGAHPLPSNTTTPTARSWVRTCTASGRSSALPRSAHRRHRHGNEGRLRFGCSREVQARSGDVTYVSSTEVRIKPDGIKDEIDVYDLVKFARTNQDTCFNHRPIVRIGDKVAKGKPSWPTVRRHAQRRAGPGPQPAAGLRSLERLLQLRGRHSSSQRARGQGRPVHLHPHQGICHRDPREQQARTRAHHPRRAQLLRKRLPRGSTSTTRASSSLAARSRPAPSSSARSRPRARPRPLRVQAAEQRIFGEKAKDVEKDSSLRLPHGIEGTVIDIQRLKRSRGR